MQARPANSRRAAFRIRVRSGSSPPLGSQLPISAAAASMSASSKRAADDHDDDETDSEHRPLKRRPAGRQAANSQHRGSWAQLPQPGADAQNQSYSPTRLASEAPSEGPPTAVKAKTMAAPAKAAASAAQPLTVATKQEREDEVMKYMHALVPAPGAGSAGSAGEAAGPESSAAVRMDPGKVKSFEKCLRHQSTSTASGITPQSRENALAALTLW